MTQSLYRLFTLTRHSLVCNKSYIELKNFVGFNTRVAHKVCSESAKAGQRNTEMLFNNDSLRQSKDCSAVNCLALYRRSDIGMHRYRETSCQFSAALSCECLLSPICYRSFGRNYQQKFSVNQQAPITSTQMTLNSSLPSFRRPSTSAQITLECFKSNFALDD